MRFKFKIKTLKMRLLAIIGLVLSHFILSAQIISFQKIDSFSVSQLENMVNGSGAPAGIIDLKYEVDFYQVLYLTPYRHKDSLVQASAGLAIPKNPTCETPIASYGHGTMAHKGAQASTQDGAQWEIGSIFASTGYVVVMPDYLGLGIPDPKVVIHPYQHAFSQGHTNLNAIRAAKEIMESEGLSYNNQLFLFGYSQGGFTTTATHRLIEEEYPNEFTVAAAAPMSGAYDMAGAQVELMASDSVYPTPGYLPYIILAYQDQYGTLYDSIRQVLKEPFDSLMPALFYPKEKSIGFINNQSTPVPKHMVQDTTVASFLADSNHILRVLLKDNEMLNWAPQAPVKLYYCTGDDQVSYVNSERAYDSWTSRGATDITKQDFGNFNHNDCAMLCFLGAKNYFDSIRSYCTSIDDQMRKGKWQVYPNPANDKIFVQWNGSVVPSGQIRIVDAIGKEWVQRDLNTGLRNLEFDIKDLAPGYYILNWKANGAEQNIQFIKTE